MELPAVPPQGRENTEEINYFSVFSLPCGGWMFSILGSRELPVAQTDDDPDRVPEVIEHFTSGPGSQVIYLTEANGEIVMHFDIESASQRVCERIARICR